MKTFAYKIFLIKKKSFESNLNSWKNSFKPKENVKVVKQLLFVSEGKYI